MPPDTNGDADLQEGTVLFVDVSGSTPLYQRLGDAAAFAAIRRFQDSLRAVAERHDGVFVKSSGDDVLCWFPRPSAAVSAAHAMLEMTAEGTLAVHAGLELGAFLCVPNDIFGDCVNAASRLCDLANTRELLVGETCFAQLDPAQQARFVGLSPLRLKGREEASRIHSLQLEETGDRTQLAPEFGAVDAQWDALFEYEGRQWRITEGDALTVGRLPGNAVQVPVGRVSRQHATIRLTNGLVEFEDHSSGGTAVTKQSGEVLAVSRRTVVLSGAGKAYLGARHADPAAPCLHYEVVPR